MSVYAPESRVFDLEDALSLSKKCSLEAFEPALRDWPEEPLVVESGQTLALVPDASCPLFRNLLTTPDLDQFKKWLGVPNALIESGKYQAPAALPHTSPKQLEKAKDQLSTEELAELKRAHDYFLFGRSDLVEDYRDALCMYYSPFQAALYVGRQVEIMPGACIEVLDAAAILFVDRLVIHAGGNLKIFTPAKVRINTLHKFDV